MGIVDFGIACPDLESAASPAQVAVDSSLQARETAQTTPAADVAALAKAPEASFSGVSSDESYAADAHETKQASADARSSQAREESKTSSREAEALIQLPSYHAACEAAVQDTVAHGIAAANRRAVNAIIIAAKAIAVARVAADAAVERERASARHAWLIARAEVAPLTSRAETAVAAAELARAVGPTVDARSRGACVVVDGAPAAPPAPAASLISAASSCPTVTEQAAGELMVDSPASPACFDGAEEAPASALFAPHGSKSGTVDDVKCAAVSCIGDDQENMPPQDNRQRQQRPWSPSRVGKWRGERRRAKVQAMAAEAHMLKIETHAHPAMTDAVAVRHVIASRTALLPVSGPVSGRTSAQQAAQWLQRAEAMLEVEDLLLGEDDDAVRSAKTNYLNLNDSLMV